MVREAVLEDAAGEELVCDLADDGAPRAVLARKAVVVHRLQAVELILHQLKQRRRLRASLSFVCTPEARHGDAVSYVIRHGRVRATLPVPRTADERRRTKAASASSCQPVADRNDNIADVRALGEAAPRDSPRPQVLRPYRIRMCSENLWVRAVPPSNVSGSLGAATTDGGTYS